jgi:hypothetical protein
MNVNIGDNSGLRLASHESRGGLLRRGGIDTPENDIFYDKTLPRRYVAAAY